MKILQSLGIGAGLLVLALSAGSANAQATRTWVSGVGDDANPCSRTAPCKTFAGAISKTATGGEINVPRSGRLRRRDHHQVDHHRLRRASRPASWCAGTNAIIINATRPTRMVILRNLSINGVGNGVSLMASASWQGAS